MKKKKNIFGILLLAFVLLLLTWWWMQTAKKSAPLATTSRPSAPAQAIATPSASVPAQDQTERRKAVVEKIMGVLATPIIFYGKVIDQNGDPVPNANIEYGTIDKFDAPGSDYTGQSDANGNFSVSGIKGAVLTVGVLKDGYYHIHGKSNGAFAYGVGPDPTRKVPPTKDKPAIFVLQKMGETVPLVRLEKSTSIPKDGTPTTVDLMSGRLTPNGNFRVEAWTSAPTEGRKFTWRCRVSVPGGGLAERKGQFDFEAPVDGYEESVEITMPQDAAQWTSQQQRDYFVKVPDNHYARVNFRMIAGGNHYFILESFLNPTPGSRNLEFDPAKVVKSP